jgi:hypothetical protein
MKTRSLPSGRRRLTSLRQGIARFGAVALTALACLPLTAQAQIAVARVHEAFVKDPSLPPAEGVYVSPAQWHAAYAQGIVIRDVRHRGFTERMPPPPPGVRQTHQFGSRVDFEVSTDGGATFQPATGQADVRVQVMQSGGGATQRIYDTEMLALDLTAGPFKLRESPTLPSRGKTSIRQVSGGYMVASFFDIFTEISLDDGATWLPAVQAANVELRADPLSVPAIPAPTSLLPPPNDVFVSPAQSQAAYAPGIVIKDVRNKGFTASLRPPTAGSQMHQFGSQLDLQVSTDGGNTFRHVRTPALARVEVTRMGNDGLFDTEMEALSFMLPLAGGNALVRESPTLPSRGQTLIVALADGSVRMSSFFDIFTEMSVDGGATWTPSSTGPVRVQLEQGAPEQPAPTPNLPPDTGEYISPTRWHALYASGIIISNVSHSRFMPSTPPPPPGGTQEHTFNSQVAFDLLQPGLPPQRLMAPAMVTVRVTSSMDEEGTRYFDTEMLQLDIQGGSLPPVMRVRESPTRASTGRTSIREDAAGDGFMVSSFFDIFTELSMDGGQTWAPTTSGPGEVRLRTPILTPVLVTCPPDQVVLATGPAGAVVNFPVAAAGGCNNTATAVATPPSGSLFPIGSTTVTVVATDACGNSATCSFVVQVTPPLVVAPEIPFKDPALPPPDGAYISPAQYHILLANGIVIRDVRHRRFTASQPPPPAGGSTVHRFDSIIDFEVSNTGPAGPFSPASGAAEVVVRVTHVGGNDAVQLFDTEMLSLDLIGSGFRLRESPTRPSRGQTTLRPVEGGHLISSFFDIWTEISLDGGQTWMPAETSGRVELRKDPALVPPIPTPTRLLPPPTDVYVSPAQWHAAYAQGIVIKDVRHKLFTQSMPPPATGTQMHQFGSQLDLMLSRDGGATFEAIRVPANPVQVELTRVSAGNVELFDTEMLNLTAILGGGPVGSQIRLRESPTLPSRGMTQIARQPDGAFEVTSFFDIFTEVSLDNGQTWHPSMTGPVRVQLEREAPEQPQPDPNLPPLDGEYISPGRWHALYASGIIISNVSHSRFFPSQPPPPPGQSMTHEFNSTVEFDLVRPGQPPIRMIGEALVVVQVTSKQSEQGTTYYDTEMLALDLHGEGLPPGLLVRESPTRASTGRTSIRLATDGHFRVGSFFDVFTELSLNGGQTWSPSLSGPGTVRLRKPVDPPINVLCPPSLIVSATSEAGAIVHYGVALGSGGCDPVPNVTCTPPSGSVFPVGTTTVVCEAKDSCGNIARCTFNVTVNRYVKPRFFPTPLLPPPTGQYVSPSQWHALYASGIIISNAAHNRFLPSVPPPPPGNEQTHVFNSQVKFDISNDGGATFHPMIASAQVEVLIVNTTEPGNTRQTFRTEMLRLDMSTGPSSGILVRESPTKASTGEVRMQPVPNGFMISSFFDIFTELSLDGGQTWSPANVPAMMELQVDPATAPAVISGVHLVGGRPTFTIPTVRGLTHLTEYTESLTDPIWRTINGKLGDDLPSVQTDHQGGGGSARFYRSRTEETLLPDGSNVIGDGTTPGTIGPR